MKKVYVLMLGLCLSCLSMQAQSEWTQIGNDIDGSNFEKFGAALGLSADGSVVAVGAIHNSENGYWTGQTRVYENTGGTWTQIGNDINGENLGDNAGKGISLSADGSVVAIGATLNDGNGSSSGQVRVYKNQSGNWVQVGGDIDGQAAGDGLGWSVSLSADGSIVAVGAGRNDANGENSGNVRVYKNQGGSWVQIGNDINGENAGDKFGHSVDLNADGSVVAIGAIYNDDGGIDAGHVRVYKNQGGNWVQIGDDIDGEAAGDGCGISVCLSADGTILAAGANYNDGNGTDSGHVRMYKNQGGSWIQMGDDIDGEAAGDILGTCVALSEDGLVVAIGATWNDGNGTEAGHVRIYKYLGGSWTQMGDDIDGENAGGHFGYSIGLSNDGSIVAIGAPKNNANGIESGHVRVYKNPSVGIEEWQALAMEAYPNPTKDMVTFMLPGNTSAKQLCVYDMMGRKMFVKTNLGDKVQIDFSDLSQGIYLVHLITTDQKVFTTRIAKE